MYTNCHDREIVEVWRYSIARGGGRAKMSWAHFVCGRCITDFAAVVVAKLADRFSHQDALGDPHPPPEPTVFSDRVLGYSQPATSAPQPVAIAPLVTVAGWGPVRNGGQLMVRDRPTTLMRPRCPASRAPGRAPGRACPVPYTPLPWSRSHDPAPGPPRAGPGRPTAPW